MKSNQLLQIFARSPFKPVQQHMNTCYTCAQLLLPLLEAAANGHREEVARLQSEITGLENEADDQKNEIRARLPRGFFLPVARPDLLELLTRQDRIANRTRGIAGLMMGRNMSFPASLTDDITEFATESVKACGQATDVVRELDELLDTGFRGRETDRVRAMVHLIDDTERRCDELEAAIRGKLFALEADLPPVDVIFMYRAIEWIGDLANHAERVGHRLDQLLAS